MAQQTRNSAAETVDRLVRIADHDESRCRLRRGDQTQQLELSRVYILELVDQHESEFRLHPRAKRRTGLQQLDGFRDEIAKVDQARLVHAVLIRLVSTGQHAQPLACARFRRKLERGRVHEVLFHERDKRKEVVGERVRPAHTVERSESAGFQVGQDLAHHDPFLEPVHEQPFAIRRVVAKDAGTEAVESRDPGLAVVIVQPLVDPARELACGPGGKGEHENLVAPGDALTHRLLIEIYERMRLPRARSGEHTKWSVYFMDVEWQQVSRGGAGDLIMRARVSWSQPRPLKAQLPKGAEPRTARSRATATA